MATVTEVFNPAQESTYDVRTGTYTITRHFQVDLNPTDAIVLYGGSLPTGIPLTFNITQSDPAYEATVHMNLVAKKCDRIKNLLSLVSVTYEGHALGVVYSEVDGSGKSETITADLDTGLGIGPKLEGTTKYSPAATFRVFQNVTRGDYWQWFEAWLPEFTGVVNESGFADPITGTHWDEGVWLYLGGTATQNRDGSFTIAHMFSMDEDGVHKFSWRPYRDTTESITIDGKAVDRPKRIYGDVVNSKIYPIAGTDTADTFGLMF